MDNQQQRNLETQIRAAIGSAPESNFDAWKQNNAEVLNSLECAKSGPQSAQPIARPRSWRLSLAAATMAFVLAATCWVLYPRDQAFAKTIEGINVANTITWVRTSYVRMISKDGERKWLKKTTHKTTYMAPGFFRYDDYDEDGNLDRTYIDNPVKKQRLTLHPNTKLFEIEDHVIHETTAEKEKLAQVPKMKLAKLSIGPFGWFNRAVTEGGEIAGQRVVDGRKVNVLRWRNEAMGIHNPKNVSDVWIDAETETIVGTSHPGSSVFDPEKLEYRDNPPEADFSRGTILGSITKDIVLNAKVDPEIFDFEIPDGFAKAPKPKAPAVITETELIEWIEVLAKINDNQFVDGFITRNTKKIAESSQLEIPLELEKQRRKIWRRHLINGNSSPLWDFVEANTFYEDCQYRGKGVKLGSAEQVILIYRLKLTGKYRAIYGDLRIEDLTDDKAKQLKGSWRYK